ncbi:MAG TPA: TetR family transcriptional regulator [Streptomyces sp.]|nr:TetR family transcriptional regulator [Streptomyces sp.]
MTGPDTGPAAGRGAADTPGPEAGPETGPGPAPGTQPEPGPAGPARKRGRPARKAADEGPGARDRILSTARAEFAERGYDKTSIRGIARKAGVDAALVHHYFGTKEQVFESAVEVSFEPALNVPDLLAQGPEGVGERLARHFLGVWENPRTRAPLLAVVRSAVTHEAAAAVLRKFVLRRLLERVAAELEVPEPRLRAELAASQLVGIAILRYVVKVEPLADADIEVVIGMIAPTLQRYLTVP